MSAAFENLRESMRILALCAWRPNEIVVGSMQYFCEKLEIKKYISGVTALTELCGIRVRENKLFPQNRASLIDETGKVIRIFEL